MRRWRLLCLATLLSSGCVTATGPRRPLQPEDKTLTADPLEPGAPAVVLDHEDTIIDGNPVTGSSPIGQRTEAVFYRIKVLTEEGRRYGDVQIPYFERGAKINALFARVIEPDGSIRTFDGQVIDRKIL